MGIIVSAKPSPPPLAPAATAVTPQPSPILIYKTPLSEAAPEGEGDCKGGAGRGAGKDSRSPFALPDAAE